MNHLKSVSPTSRLDNELNLVIGQVKGLNLSPVQSNIQSQSQQQHAYFGKVEAVIDQLGIVTVKAEPSKIVLDFGTAIFAQTADPNENSDNDHFTLIGYVDDVFGPIKSPMYAVKSPSLQLYSIFKGQKVYYVNNSETKFFCIDNLYK